MSIEQWWNGDYQRECDNVLPGQGYFTVIENILNLEEQVTSLSRIFENKMFGDVSSHTWITEMSSTLLRKPKTSHCKN